MTASLPWHANWHLRLLLFDMLVPSAFGALTWRLWQVQVRDGPLYTARLAARSEIRDRHGLLLAENCSSFDVEFYFPEMVRDTNHR